MRPNFVIIGAARSGTTSLFKYLECHPEIFMSEIKEINFFSNQKYWSKGFDWYERHFDNTNKKRVGEASTSYSSFPTLPHVPQRIHEHLPKVKLIYLLRDPIDRFKSDYLHRVARSTEYRDAMDIIENYRDDSLFIQGKYFLQLQQYYEYFPQESVHILTTNSLKNKPAETVKAIYEFLEVDTSFSDVRLDSHHNKNSVVTRKNRFGNRVLHFYHNHIEQVAYPYRFKKLFLSLAEIGAVEVGPLELDEKAMQILTDYYREDVQQLKASTDLDLSEWRDYS